MQTQNDINNLSSELDVSGINKSYTNNIGNTNKTSNNNYNNNNYSKPTNVIYNNIIPNNNYNNNHHRDDDEEEYDIQPKKLPNLLSKMK